MIEKELLLLLMADGDSRLPLFSLTPSLKSFSTFQLCIPCAMLAPTLFLFLSTPRQWMGSTSPNQKFSM
jgi:hypothetical protein